MVLAWALLSLCFPPYILPSPWAVLEAISRRGWELLGATLLTGAAALAGFLLSLLMGYACGLSFARFPWLEKGFFPYAIFFQTVPVVAVAPLIILWVGHGFWGVVAVAFIISIFPIISGSTQGLTRIEPQRIELFQLYGASRKQRLLKLQIPSSLPQTLAGARISSGLSVIGAIVGEFSAGFGSGHHGLGYLILFSSGQLKTPTLFASIMASTLLGYLVFALVHHGGGWLLRRQHYSLEHHVSNGT